MEGSELLQRYKNHYSRPLPEVVRDLESYAALLTKWQAVQNLVSRETLPDVWQRHFLDSLQLCSYLKASDGQMLDLGSGGGLPALPLAIASKSSGRKFVLVEPNARKVSFLRTVSRELGLEVDVIGLRSDQIDSRETLKPNVITSRALASFDQLCAWMQPFWAEHTRALLHKGREHVEELKEADSHWQFDVLTHRSDADSSGVILEITNLRGRNKR